MQEVSDRKRGQEQWLTPNGVGVGPWRRPLPPHSEVPLPLAQKFCHRGCPHLSQTTGECSLPWKSPSSGRPTAGLNQALRFHPKVSVPLYLLLRKASTRESWECVRGTLDFLENWGKENCMKLTVFEHVLCSGAILHAHVQWDSREP